MNTSIDSDTRQRASHEPEYKTDLQICKRCIMDESVSGITFDQEGICNFCKLHNKLEKKFPNNDRGDRIISAMMENIRRSGKGKKHDCVIGISGGRDSTYMLYMACKVWGLRPLAVHFNDGFGNPVGGKNMVQASKKLGVELRTITSDWRESKDIRIAFLKSSSLNIGIATDLGIAASLYGVASKENLKYILIGNSFRTEGIVPLAWSYFDGYYLKKIHQGFGSFSLRPWKADDPGFNLDLPQIFYYSILKRIKTFTPIYYMNYIRPEVDELLHTELGWENTGAHYYDDLYQSLMFYYERVKFNVDRRKPNYSALIRSEQMSRNDAIKRLETPYIIEDPKVINLCIKRLGITREEFDEFVARPPKYFRDFPNRYHLLLWLKPIVKILSLLHMIPEVTFDKYYNCG